MEEQLWQACSDGKVEEVRKLLQNSQTNTNWQDSDGWTPLYIACCQGHIEVVKLLLNDERLDINRPILSGATPFFIACQEGHIEIVKLLLNDERVDINKAMHGSEATPFYFSCYKGHIEIVKLLLSNEKVDINKAMDDEVTPFFIACQEGHIEIVKLLLNSERVDFNKTMRHGQTPFYIACQEGHIEVVKLLLSNEKVDINKADNKYDVTPFYIACEEGHIDIVKLLLNDNRTDMNKGNKSDWTPFFIACFNGHIEIVKLLLNDEKIDINKESIEGVTPLLIATFKSFLEIVRLLLNDKKIEVQKPMNKTGYTPIQVACVKGDVEIVKLFLENKRVDLNKEDNNGETPFYAACKEGQTEVVRLLLKDRRVDFYKQNNLHVTPFYKACNNGHVETTTLLWETLQESRDLHALLYGEAYNENRLNEKGQATLTKAQETFNLYKTQRNQRLISTSKIQEITKEAEDFSTFQIHFLPFQKFLELEIIPKHEDCKDKLVNFTFEQMKETTDQLVFISHRWLSQNHPDPHSEQLNAIKDSFKSDPSQHRILIWYDYFSMPQHFDDDSKQKRVATIYRLNQIVTFSDSFLVLSTEDYFHRCWCFYEWSAAVFTGQKVQFYPNKFQTSEESLSFLSELMSSFHDNDEPSKEKFIQKFIAYIESDKNLVWDNLMKVYDEETVIRYKKKLDTTQVRNWTVDEVCSWLISIQFSQYQEKFREHKINGSGLFRLYFDKDKNIFQSEEDYQKLLAKIETLIPLSIWSDLDFSAWIKTIHWIEQKVVQECCEVIAKRKLSPGALLKEKGDIKREYMGVTLAVELLVNVFIWNCEKGLVDNFSWYSNGPLGDRIIKTSISKEKTPLFVACENGQIEIVKLLLNHKEIDPNIGEQISVYQRGALIFKAEIARLEGLPAEEIEDKDTKASIPPFFVACEKGHIEIVKLLLNDPRIDINKPETLWNTTPFYLACHRGDTEVVKLLINDKRADLNKTTGGQTPFYGACWNGQIEIIKLLVNNEEVDVNKTDDEGATPFYIACEKGHLDVVKLLLTEERIDINEESKKTKMTPLCTVCSNGHSEVLKLLLRDKRIDTKKRGPEKGFTVLHIACLLGKIEVVSILLDDGRVDVNGTSNDGETALFLICTKGDKEVVKVLLDNEKIDINKAGENGWTPFQISCAYGDVEIVKLFLNYKRINVNQEDENGATPFWISCHKGRSEVVEQLLNDSRVDINKADNNNVTPFFTALMEGKIEVIKVWISSPRFEPNGPIFQGGAPPLSLVCCFGLTEIVQLLLKDSRIDLNKTDDEQETAFLTACAFGHLQIVQLILNDQRFIKLNHVNKYGMDAFWISSSNGHLSVVEYLLNSGRKLNFDTKWNVDTPFERANHKTVVEQVRYQISPGKVRFTWEIDEILEKISENCPLILKLLEQYLQSEPSKSQGNEQPSQIGISPQTPKDAKIILTGKFLKLGKGLLNQWQPRIFDLSLKHLAWKKSESDNAYVNSISIQDIKTVELVPDSKFSKENVLGLKTTKKYYYLQFSNKTILEQWFDALHITIGANSI